MYDHGWIQHTSSLCNTVHDLVYYFRDIYIRLITNWDGKTEQDISCVRKIFTAIVPSISTHQPPYLPPILFTILTSNFINIFTIIRIIIFTMTFPIIFTTSTNLLLSSQNMRTPLLLIQPSHVLHVWFGYIYITLQSPKS